MNRYAFSRRSSLWSLIGVGTTALALVAMLALLPTAGAQGGPTPTVAPLGNLIIPTATPAASNQGGGGLLIPTATPAQGGGGGGFTIPTSTPGAAQAGPAIPVLDDSGLTAINLQPADVPGDFAANQSIDTYDTQTMLSGLRDGGYTDLANQFEQIATTYGWTKSIGVTYTSCQPNVPISEIYSEIGQLGSADLARRFFDDPNVLQLLSSFGYDLKDAGTVHGWRGQLAPQAGACFAQETEHVLFFEYWGIFVTLTMTADANTDPALVQGLLDQLAPVVTSKIDAMASSPFPPTPVPGAAVQQPNNPIPTQAPPPPVNPPAGAGLTLADLEKLMPTQDFLGLPADTFSFDQSLSGSFTLDQLVTNLNGLGLTELANITDQAGKRDGQVGMVGYVWDTGNACPNTAAYSLEIDLTLFQTPEGAVNNMNDRTIQQAWINTGVVSSFTPSGNGVLASGTFSNQCGQVGLLNLIVTEGRTQVAVAAIFPTSTDSQQILSALQTMNDYMVQQVAQAAAQ